MKLLAPRSNSKLIVVDMVLPVPRSPRDRRVLALKRALFGAVDVFVSYARNTRGIQELFGLPESRFAYVPFKVNDFERIAEMETSDQGYLVVAGQTRKQEAPLPVRRGKDRHRLSAGRHF